MGIWSRRHIPIGHITSQSKSKRDRERIFNFNENFLENMPNIKDLKLKYILLVRVSAIIFILS